MAAEHIPRRDYIASVMEKQGAHGNPRKWLVLREWNTIVDHDRTYEVQVPPLPSSGTEGCRVYVMARPDSPELSLAKVVEDRGEDGLFVEPVNNPAGVQFLVPREDVKLLPIPLRPTAILRSQLKVFIGDEAAEAWNRQRRDRRNAK